jgi:2-dehydropantoate 2-reductase
MTKICIYGAGAIGGYMAACLDHAGAEVSLIARGPHLAAIREKGLRLSKDGSLSTHKLHATDNPDELGPQDYVILALKAHGIPKIIDQMGALLGPDTAIVSAVNGVPWWYFHQANTGTILDNKPVEAVDPKGRIFHEIGAERAIGCVVYPACEISEPGVIQHIDGERFSLGEPSGNDSRRVKSPAKAKNTRRDLGEIMGKLLV